MSRPLSSLLFGRGLLDSARQGLYYRLSITQGDTMIRDFFLGFIKLHLLYHAARGPIFGLDMIRELEEHGYTLSPGTLYPMLHGLEQDGYLKSEKQVVNGKTRKYYSATVKGKKALADARRKARELLDEISREDGDESARP